MERVPLGRCSVSLGTQGGGQARTTRLTLPWAKILIPFGEISHQRRPDRIGFLAVSIISSSLLWLRLETALRNPWSASIGGTVAVLALSTLPQNFLSFRHPVDRADPVILSNLTSVSSLSSVVNPPS
jgi:hypothetical protein